MGPILVDQLYIFREFMVWSWLFAERPHRLTNENSQFLLLETTITSVKFPTFVTTGESMLFQWVKTFAGWRPCLTGFKRLNPPLHMRTMRNALKKCFFERQQRTFTTGHTSATMKLSILVSIPSLMAKHEHFWHILSSNAV